MAIELKLGETVPLSLLLEDGATDKFPIAIVYDQNNATIPGSPFYLTHLNYGRYVNSSLSAMNPYTHLEVVYITYEDSGYTTESYYGRTEDEFDILNSGGSGLPISFQSDVPEEIEVPISGGKAYVFYVNIFDNEGFPKDPDGTAITITLKTASNVAYLPPQAMSRDQVGVYRYTYIVNSTDPEQVLVAYYNFNIAGHPMEYTDTLEVLATRKILDQVLSATAAIIGLENLIKAQTDKFMFTGNYVQSTAVTVQDKSGYSLTTANINTVVNAIWDEPHNNHLLAGTFGLYLDTLVSSRQSTADALSQYGFTAKQSTLNLVKAQTDLMHFNGNNILAETAVIDDKNGYSITAGNIATIASAVWDQLKINHTIAGSYGSLLDAQVSLGETESLASARFNAVAKQADLLSVKAKTDQLHFNGNNVLSEAVVVDDKLGYGLSSAERTILTNDMWDEPLAGHLTLGTTGYYLSLAGSGSVSPSAIASAVWGALRSSYATANTFGEALQGVLSPTRASNLDFLDVAVSSRESATLANSIASANLAQHSLTQSLINNAQASINDIISTLGTPSTTIAGDIAAVSAGFPPAVGADITQILTNTVTILSRLGVPSTTISAEIADLLSRIGLPSSNLTTLINDLTTDVGLIPTNPLLATDSRLINLDATISSRATPADITAAISGLGLNLVIADIEGVVSTDVNGTDSVVGVVENSL